MGNCEPEERTTADETDASVRQGESSSTFRAGG